MCGIAGFVGDIARAPDAPARLSRMTSSLAHRGPDGQGCWIGGDVGLGQTRLAIIDIDGGKQPLWDAAGVNVIVFNGEIYNSPALRRELEARGYRFRTRSDTEVIPAVLDAWGIEAGLLRLRGMFAFAVYNTRTRRLLLARDRVGIKPLYIARANGMLLFASEVKALLASDLVRRSINPVAVHDYLALGYPITPATCWADIEMVAPATWLEVGPETTRTGRYWSWQPRESMTCSLDEGVQTLEHTLSDALQAHLLSDVPVGAFLSGGLDSSLNVALLSRGLAPGIQTFCMGFGDVTYDESDHARRVAETCGTTHHEMRMNGNGATADVLFRVLEHQDEPFGDSSSIPTFLLCGKVREHVKVVLSGDGGDETLGGYLRYHRARRLAHLSHLRGLFGAASPLVRFAASRAGTLGRRAEKAMRFAQMPRAEMLLALHVYFHENERFELYRPEFADRVRPAGPTSHRFARFVPSHVADPRQQLIAVDMALTLHADYLRKVDTASSAHGLEVRVPYLDNAMLDLASVLPADLKVSQRGETKVLSRRLVSRLLPHGTASRQKRGFDLPLDTWMGPEMRSIVKDQLLGPGARLTSYLRREAVNDVWNAFLEDGSEGKLSRYTRHQRLFLLLSLETWLRRWAPSLA